MFSLIITLSVFLSVSNAFSNTATSVWNVRPSNSIAMNKFSASNRLHFNTNLQMADKNSKEKESDKSGFERFTQLLEESGKVDPSKKKPPIYEPGPYPVHLLAALAYVIPIVDASDVGKYMFEAYPVVGESFNLVYGPLAALYNGVPFLPFLVFFLMSYICRAPTFPVEVRFHFAQAFMLSIIQFIPSILFGVMEKAGVPGMGVLYNTLFLWVMVSSILMQGLLLNPLSSLKNPFLLNIAGWAMKYMNYTPDLVPK